MAVVEWWPINWETVGRFKQFVKHRVKCEVPEIISILLHGKLLESSGEGSLKKLNLYFKETMKLN